MNRFVGRYSSAYSYGKGLIQRSLNPLSALPLLHASYSSSSSSKSESNHNWILPSVLLTSSLLLVDQSIAEKDPRNDIEYNTQQVITNWSETHSCAPLKVYEPKSSQQVLRLLQSLPNNEKLRPIGTGLSPNGIGMSNYNLISLSALDSITVDPKRQLVTVGGGARVSEVLKELKKYDLTLQNFSSIQEQQMAGWTQVAAHGTGATLPTVDDMIVRLKLATPTEGLLTLTNESYPDLFPFAKVGLGALGIVTELTLKCIPKHSLLEHTYSTSVNDIGTGHYDRLKNYRHVRYMWLPYTSQVVTVVSNPIDEKTQKPITADPVQAIITDWKERQLPQFAHLKPTHALISLLKTVDPSITNEDIENLSFTQLRDRLLEYDPLNRAHIAAVNHAEAEFWKLSTGSRIDDSTNILGFDCGGEQYVFEVCFPIGKLSEQSNKDIEFVQKLLQLIQDYRLPAPCPIEQRWTSRSTSKMSPAYSDDSDQIFSWVGIILYIPKVRKQHHQQSLLTTEQEKEASEIYQKEIEREFHKCINLIKPLCDEYGAYPHWAKIEIPKYVPLTEYEQALVERKENSESGLFSSLLSFFTQNNTTAAKKQHPIIQFNSNELLLQDLQQRLQQKYPLEEFNDYRRVLDSKNHFGNELIDTLFQYPSPAATPPLPAATKKN